MEEVKKRAAREETAMYWGIRSSSVVTQEHLRTSPEGFNRCENAIWVGIDSSGNKHSLCYLCCCILNDLWILSHIPACIIYPDFTCNNWYSRAFAERSALIRRLHTRLDVRSDLWYTFLVTSFRIFKRSYHFCACSLLKAGLFMGCVALGLVYVDVDAVQ